MKKSLSKPANWQDFEDLCRKLFGEVWDCKNTIRKNGRSGQDQAGVDVYAIPKGEDGYFGIQCKGKDDYTQARVTEKEVLAEISKAAGFEPPLKVFIIATTANKDAKLEAFIRREDLKSRNAGQFGIQLFAWEDLADLILENCETYLWYVEGKHFRVSYGFTLLADGQAEPIIRPVYYRKTTYYISEKFRRQLENSSMGRMMAMSAKLTAFMPVREPRLFNYAYSRLNFQLLNTGSMVLDDWKFSMQFDAGQVKAIDDDYDGEPNPNPVAIFRVVRTSEIPLMIDKKQLSVLFKPVNNQALIQHDQRNFAVWILPAGHETSRIDATWELLARDFRTTGTMSVLVEPQYERASADVIVENGEEPPENATVVVEKIAEKEQE